MIDANKHVSIISTVNDKTYFYNGSIVDEDDYFIHILDRYNGYVRLSKSSIISITEKENPKPNGGKQKQNDN